MTVRLGAPDGIPVAFHYIGTEHTLGATLNDADPDIVRHRSPKPDAKYDTHTHSASAINVIAPVLMRINTPTAISTNGTNQWWILPSVATTAR